MSASASSGSAQGPQGSGQAEEPRLERLVLRLGSWPWILLPWLLVWASAVPCGYTLDDVTLIERDPRVLELRWGELLTTPLWPAAPGGGGLYRPLMLLSFALEQRLHGSVHVMHLVNALLHLGVCLALRPVLGTLLTARGAAAAALLFLVHPLHVEAVTGLVGRAEVLGLLLGLLAWWAVLSERPAGGWWLRAAAGAAFLGGLLCKESVATLLPVIASHRWWLARRAGATRGLACRAALGGVAPLGVALLVAIGWRLIWLGASVAPVDVPHTLNPLAESPLEARLATGVVLLVRYAWLCVYPVRLVADYSFAALPTEEGPLDWRPALALVGVAGALVAAGLRARGTPARAADPVPLLALGWFVLLLGAVLQVVPIGTLFAERFAYAPSLALCLLAGWGYQRTRPSGVGPLVLLLLCLAGGARAAVRNLDFRDSSRLFLVTARDQPRSAQAQLYRAWDLLERDRLADALPHLAAAREIDPTQSWAALQLGRALRLTGRPDLAASHLEAARELLPEDPRPPLELAFALVVLDQRARAGALLDEARARGLTPEARAAAALALRRAGDAELAARLEREPR